MSRHQMIDYPMHLDPLDRIARQLHDTYSTSDSEPYVPEPYQPLASIVRTHLLPRLGYPKDIDVIWDGSDDQIEAYIIGIFVNSIIIVIVMLISLVVMAILNCKAYDRVGLWVGHFEHEGTSEDGDYYRDDDDGDDDCNVKSENGSRNGGSGVIENGINSGITEIIAVSTIGSGEFKDKSYHISTAIEEAGSCNGMSEVGIPVNAAKNGGDSIEYDGDDTCTTLRAEPESPPADKDSGEEWVVDNENKGTNSSNASEKPKPVPKRFRLKVAQIDARNGKIIDLRPKPVPRELYLKVKLVRWVFVASGFGAIISSGLFYALGVKKFKQSLVDTRSGINQFNQLSLETINVTDNLLDVLQMLESGLNATDKAIGVAISSCDLQSAANWTEFIEYYGTVKENFIAVSDSINDLLNGFNDNMWNIVEATSRMYEQTYMANIAFTIMVVVMCVMIILIFIMIIGVAFAAWEIENCFTCFMRRILLLPIFVLQVILAALFSAVFFIGALPGSDFCVAPDQHAQRLLARVAAGTDDSLSPLFTVFIFYLSGCQGVNDQNVAQAIENTVNAVNGMLGQAHDLFYSLSALTPQEAFKYCTADEETIILVRYIDELGMTLHNVTHQLYTALDAALDIVSCESVYPVYSFLVHDAICTGAVGGMASIFSTLLVIAVLSMTMLALRAALLPIHVLTSAKDREGSETPEENEVESVVNHRCQSKISTATMSKGDM